MEADAWVDKERGRVLVLALHAAKLKLPVELLQTLVFECCLVNQHTEDGARHGTWRAWNPCGILAREYQYVFGKQCGMHRRWRMPIPEGDQICRKWCQHSSVIYPLLCSGVADSLRWGAVLLQQTLYVDDKRNGIDTCYWWSGAGVWTTTTFVNGSRHGPHEAFNEDGTLQCIAVYKQDEACVIYALAHYLLFLDDDIHDRTYNVTPPTVFPLFDQPHWNDGGAEERAAMLLHHSTLLRDHPATT